MMSANSLGKIGDDEHDLSDERSGRRQKMNCAKSTTSKMSMISELTDYEAAGTGKEKSSKTLNSRARQMEHAKGMVSNMSMFSELTDMTGDFSNLDIGE